MKKIIIIAAALFIFASCKKENCNCFKITSNTKILNMVNSENVCTGDAKMNYIFDDYIESYPVGKVVCDDPFIF